MINNISDFLDQIAKNYQDTTALYIRRLFRIEKYTYQDLYNYSLKTSRLLSNLNIKPEDKILIWAPNMPEWVIAYFGALTYGVIVVPVNVHTSSTVLQKYIRQTKPKLLIKSKFIIDKKENKTPKTLFIEDLIDKISNLTPLAPTNINKDSLAEIVFTSGTTGDPKGVMITHQNILFQIKQLLKIVPDYPEYRLLSILPLSHVMEQIVGLFAPLYRGATIYYVPRLNALTIEKALYKYSITHLGIVPQLLRVLLDTIEYQVVKEGKEKQYRFALRLAPYLPFFLRRILFRNIHNRLGGKLKIFGCGSAPLNASLARIWENFGIKVIEGYGTSETTGAITANTFSKQVFGSVGKIISGMQVTISDSGEILAKGKNVSPGYYNDLKKTRENYTSNGFFRTGDIGFLNNNYLYLTGRDKFKIVTAAGDKVYPEDVERKLNANPLIWDSCVFGIDKGQGEIVYACIITKHPNKISRIIQQVNQQLETHQQILDYQLWPQKDFPRLYTLKIDREKVKEYIENTLQGKTSAKALQKEKISKDQLINILTTICKVNRNKIKDDTKLVSDLDLDSLKRVTLVALIEDEFGVIVEESAIDEQTTLENLRKKIARGNKKATAVSFAKWPLSLFTVEIRELLRNVVLFPLQNNFANIIVENKDNLSNIPHPSILIFNHAGHFDSTVIVRILPKSLRKKLFVVADADLYKTHWRAFLLYLFGNAYPLDKRGGPVRDSLELISDLLEQGLILLIAPEGAINPDGSLHEFKKGVGMFAVETGVPVVPFKIKGYRKIYPRIKDFPYWPEGKGDIIVKVGKPLRFSKTISYEQAIKQMRDVLEKM